jgi:transposase
MGETKQRYSEEFKKQAVKYIQEQTKSVNDIAEELNIPAATLRKWLSQYREFQHEPTAERVRQLEQELKEKDRALAAQKRELDDLREELTIIKKAVHIFSKQKN